MKIKHDDIIIDDEKPFSNCALGREKYAKILSNIVATYAEGFVLAIDNKWGTGKTTFVKMWQRQLVNDGFQTLYFNAWENDFESNPLVAFISELKTLITSETKEYKTLLEKGAIITKNVLPQIAKAIANRYLDTAELADVIENTTKGVTEILKDEVKEYASKKKGLREFRNSLSKFVKVTKGDKPIIFIIDELDRCRPNYSVELLEQIKHFFSVAGIVFVLSIDKIQLSHAIRGFYGNDRIDADEYLRRFIDIEYALPQPGSKLFSGYLYNYFGFKEFFKSEQRSQHRTFEYDEELFINMSAILFEQGNITLRQQEKIFAHARLALSSFKSNQYVFPTLFIILLFIKNYYNPFYSKIYYKKLSLEQLIDEFNNILPTGIPPNELRMFIQMEALLVFLYNNYAFPRTKSKLLVTDENTGEETCIVRSKLDDSPNNNVFMSFIKSFLEHWDYGDIQINYIMSRIDLMEDVILN